MASKVILALCSIALFVQMAFAQANCGCSNSGLGLGLAGNSLAGYSNAYSGSGSCGSNSAYVGSGGGFTVTTYSPITPAGVSIRSENGIEGNLCVDGALPVLSVVALEGQLATSGQAGVQYGCGSGTVGITSGNGAGQTGAGWGSGAGVAGAGWSNGAGLSGGINGCGCCGY